MALITRISLTIPVLVSSLLNLLPNAQAAPTNHLAETSTSRVVAASTNRSIRSRLKFRVIARSSRPAVIWLSAAPPRCNGATLTPLIPPLGLARGEQINRSQSPIDYTITSHPTIWINIPNLPTGTTARLGVFKEGIRQKSLYSPRFNMPDTSGIIGVQIPSSKLSLEVGVPYRWVVQIYCPDRDSDDRSHGQITGGWIQRIDANQLSRNMNPDRLQAILQKLTTEKPEDRAPLYADLGLFQDAITSIAQLRLKNGADPQLEQDWKDLLTQTKMESFLLKEPILKIF
jgi:Domain of Unknown Function (DUF928)